MNKLKIKLRDLSTKNHKLRSKGEIPGSIYGPMVKNTPVKLSRRELEKAHRQSGEIHQVMSQSGPMMVKFDEIQLDPLTNDYIHFSLVQLPPGLETDIAIPVEFKGTPVGVRKGGVFVVLKDEVMVNATPKELPEELPVSVKDLDIGDKITIKDLEEPRDIDLVEKADEVVAICQPPAKELIKSPKSLMDKKEKKEELPETLLINPAPAI